MEPEGLVRTLTRVTEHLPVKVLATDRHMTVGKIMRTTFPGEKST